MHRKEAVDNDNPKRRHETVLFYNATKGGVDTADEILRDYLSKLKAGILALAVFLNLLDIVCLNTLILLDIVTLDALSALIKKFKIFHKGSFCYS